VLHSLDQRSLTNDLRLGWSLGAQVAALRECPASGQEDVRASPADGDALGAPPRNVPPFGGSHVALRLARQLVEDELIEHVRCHDHRGHQEETYTGSEAIFYCLLDRSFGGLGVPAPRFSGCPAPCFSVHPGWWFCRLR
jgi:hypothetical protein